MKTSIFSSFRSTHRIVGAGLCGVALLGVVEATVAPAQAAKRSETGLAPWAGRRVLFLTPLQLGDTWNADVNFGRAILPSAERMLHDALQGTGKFSVEEPRVLSPLVQRGLQEKRLDETLVTRAVIGESGNAPGVQDVAALAGQFIFDNPAMVANFRLEEVRGGGTAQRPTVQVVVSGQLYEMRGGTLNPQPFKSLRVTSDVISEGRSNIERFSGAAKNAFEQAAAAFVAPIEDVVFARPAENTPAPVRPDAIKNTGKTNGASSGRGMVQEVPAPQLPIIEAIPEAGTATPDETVMPDETTPDATTTTPDPATPDLTAPDVTTPDVTTPDGVVDGGVPELAIPEAAPETIPEVVVPDENAPDAAAPPVDRAEGGPL